MKTCLRRTEIIVKDERIVKLDQIVAEVKQSEEWEELKVSYYSVVLQRGEEIGRKKGEETSLKAMVKTLKGLLPDVESVWKAVIENDIYKDVSLGKIKQLY